MLQLLVIINLKPWGQLVIGTDSYSLLHSNNMSTLKKNVTAIRKKQQSKYWGQLITYLEQKKN